jgi:hypothetical protein
VHNVSLDTNETNPVTRDPISNLTPKPDDYVWDVFYHRPVTLSEWNEVANVGTLCVSPQFVAFSIWYTFRSGLPPSITDPYDSASESEEEDEADEDSNGSILTLFQIWILCLTVFLKAEEYYKNDYPDEDESFSEDSAGSGTHVLSLTLSFLFLTITCRCLPWRFGSGRCIELRWWRRWPWLEMTYLHISTSFISD